MQDSDLTWISVAASFDNEEQELGKLLDNENVYKGKKLTTNTAVPCRLCRDKRFADFYKEVLNADEKIVKIVLQVYKVPLEKGPPPFVARNNKSCLRHIEFAVQELQRLAKLQCVKRVFKGGL